MLQDTKLPSYMWGKALKLFVRFINATPTSALPNVTPYKAWHKEKPDLSMLRVFGCRAYVHVQKPHRQGLQSHTRNCIHLGFEDGYKGWKCYDPQTKSIVVSRDVIFDEAVSPGLTQSEDMQLAPATYQPPSAIPLHSGDTELPQVPQPQAPTEPTPNAQSHTYESNTDVDSPETSETMPSIEPSENTIAGPCRRSTRQRNPVNYRILNDPFLQLQTQSTHEVPMLGGAPDETSTQALNFAYCEVTLPNGEELAYGTIVDQNDELPNTFTKAMSRTDTPKWQMATDQEVQSLIDNGTWEIVELPQNKRAIGSRWVFRIKRKANGELDRYKARVVAKGYSQRPGIDYDEVFAPTARWAALHTILANGALEGAYIESIDISNAYLNGVLDSGIEVFMKQPKGYHKGNPNMVCKLNKGLYGLKQGGQLWYERLGDVLRDMGFKLLKSDNSVYVWTSDGIKIIVPVFIDDLTLVSKSKEAIDRVKAELAATFKLKDLGPTSFLLGVQVIYNQEERTLKLSQQQYIVDLLKRFGMSDCKPVATPMVPGL